MSSIRTELASLLEDAYQRLKDDPAAPADWVVPPDVAITVHKLRQQVPVSCCVMTDATGENHCDHPAPSRPPWHRRLRWRVQDRWRRMRMQAGSWVAGVDLDRDYDD